jgi:hypothetical protein
LKLDKGSGNVNGIKRKGFVLVSALVLLAGCQNAGEAKPIASESPSPTTAATATATPAPTTAATATATAVATAPAGATMTDEEAKVILGKLIPQAADLVGGVFNGSGWFKEDKTQTIPDDKNYVLVTGEQSKQNIDLGNVKSVADLKQAVENVFTKDTAQEIFYRIYFEMKDEGLPLYKDHDGKLYVNSKNGGHGFATKFLVDTAKVVSQKDNVVEISMGTTVMDDPQGPLIVKITQVDGEWRMASGLDDYAPDAAGASK